MDKPEGVKIDWLPKFWDFSVPAEMPGLDKDKDTRGLWFPLTDLAARDAAIRRELKACGNPLVCEGTCQGCSDCAELLREHNAKIRREALEEAAHLCRLHGSGEEFAKRIRALAGEG